MTRRRGALHAPSQEQEVSGLTAGPGTPFTPAADIPLPPSSPILENSPRHEGTIQGPEPLNRQNLGTDDVDDKPPAPAFAPPPAPASPVPPTVVYSSSPAPVLAPEPTTTRGHRVKVAKEPEPFSGNRSNLEYIISNNRLYFDTYPCSFVSDKKKITYMLTNICGPVWAALQPYVNQEP
ncbi:hypothetical protein L198_07940 [Cryptococcus wingfieldii CBS 7118]|uniref:DUF4939 domain-containing protein n=1 Tax=Cryptococcus wingfieldii CBS 7118 TaxID=1295528 RepID=A0A1E3HUA8_9TREE|nr:hypothetical protein L198_07940 [Cryptococcus wingfieldii CBS 7118]ODN79061.1 hypothetical protein L198_07940 [Cryptococcus wingfieldii CBS 7118]